VATKSPDAQAFYDQGLAYLQSYVWIEAARSFNQALRVDPALAIAQAGLSVALNELNAPAKAQAALDRARALSAKASEHDRAHIEARALQMAAEASHQNDALAAYRNALDAALQKFPSDVELWLLRGVAQSPDPADRGQGSVQASVPFFEKALTLAPNRFAAQHYLTHAYENGRRAGDALPFAASYAKAAPAVPHALHMHGHVLRQLGRVEEAVAAFGRPGFRRPTCRPRRSRRNWTGTTSTTSTCWRRRIATWDGCARPRGFSAPPSSCRRRSRSRCSTSGSGPSC
jgi:tetratricopeptide (TPR) repeat protein